jgi:hypothetical protein
VVGELGMFRTWMGSTVDQNMVTVAWDALYDKPSNSDSNQYMFYFICFLYLPTFI